MKISSDVRGATSMVKNIPANLAVVIKNDADIVSVCILSVCAISVTQGYQQARIHAVYRQLRCEDVSGGTPAEHDGRDEQVANSSGWRSHLPKKPLSTSSCGTSEAAVFALQRKEGRKGERLDLCSTQTCLMVLNGLHA